MFGYFHCRQPSLLRLVVPRLFVTHILYLTVPLAVPEVITLVFITHIHTVAGLMGLVVFFACRSIENPRPWCQSSLLCALRSRRIRSPLT